MAGQEMCFEKEIKWQVSLKKKDTCAIFEQKIRLSGSRKWKTFQQTLKMAKKIIIDSEEEFTGWNDFIKETQ